MVKDNSLDAQENGKKYARFEHNFVDAWEGTEKEFSFRFAKPTKTQIKMMQKTAVKDAAQAAQNLLVNIIHPDEKEALLSAADEYPGLITSFAGGIIKAVGIADLGN